MNNFIEGEVESIEIFYQIIDSNNQIILEGTRELEIEDYVNSLSSRTHSVTGTAITDINTEEDITYSWGFTLSDQLTSGSYILAI